MPEITVSVTYDTIDNPAEMVAQLAAAVGRGWYGTITATQRDDGELWALVMNTPTNASPVTVVVGNVLLWDGTTYQSLTADQFAERYGS